MSNECLFHPGVCKYCRDRNDCQILRTHEALGPFGSPLGYGEALMAAERAAQQQRDLRKIGWDDPEPAIIHDQGWDQVLLTPVSDRPFVVPDWRKRRRRRRVILGLILVALVIVRLLTLAS